MAVVRSDLNNVFGANNVTAWADIDNDGNTSNIDARVTYAINLATEEVSSKLRLMTYTLSAALEHVLVEHAIIQRAGDLLYSPRAISDEDPAKDLMGFHRRQYESFFKELAAGRLDLGLTRNCRPYPKVEEDAVQSSITPGY